MNNQKNKEEDKLRKLLGHQSPFKVPANYFDKLPREIQQQVSIVSDFEKSAVTNPFQAPADYFETLPGIISEKVTKTNNVNIIQQFKQFFQSNAAIGVATLVIIFISGMLYMFKLKNENPANNYFTVEDFGNSTILFSMDESLFIDVMATQQTEPSDKSIEQYLIDNNIDISQIEYTL